jgi:hypothetical protein
MASSASVLPPERRSRGAPDLQYPLVAAGEEASETGAE